MKSKYHSRKCELDGIRFDSVKEMHRYAEYKVLEKGGVIKDLKLQVKFQLIPAQKDESGRVVERAVEYIADFVYRDSDTGLLHVVDAKGVRTREYIIKRKLMLWVHGIKIEEV